MRKDYSAPVVTARPARSTQKSGGQQEEKQVDYTGLDILEQVERVLDEKLYTHYYVRGSSKWQCKCPFPGCTSTTDSFLLWVGREVLEEGQMHYHCTHCRKKGDLINFYRDYREATTGERPDWKEAARFFGINTRTWKVDGQGGQETEGAAKRRQDRERQHQAEQEEIDQLGGWYRRACKWLAVGQITLKDGRQIALETARLYLQERGFSLEQAALLGLAYIPTAKEFPEIVEDQKLAPWRGRILFPLAGPKSAGGYAGRSLFLWKSAMPAEQHKKLLDAWNEKHKGDWTKQVHRYRKTRQAAYYGYEQARQCSTLVIVEGEFDAASVRLALGDLPDIAVCAFGKEFQARLVPVNVLKVILALDGDQAGQEAITRQVDELEGRGVEVEIARPPVGKDWNDCLLGAGIDAIRAAILPEQENKNTNLMFSPAEQRAGAGNGEEKGGKERKTAVADAGKGEQEARETVTLCDAIPAQQQRIEPPGYENGDICLLCGQKPDLETEGAFYICEDKASEFYGDLFCSACWAKQNAPAHANTKVDDIVLTENQSQSDLADTARAYVCQGLDADQLGSCTLTVLPAGMSSAEYIERWYKGERPGQVIAGQVEQVSELARNTGDQQQYRCEKHGKPFAYSDEMGGRYCDHVDCWERYRLIRAGAQRGYSALVGIIDRRTVADTSDGPLYYIDIPGSDERMPVYPDRKPLTATLIEAGADAWRDYVATHDYQAIDQAVKALAS